jgi:hypothetical protein
LALWLVSDDVRGSAIGCEDLENTQCRRLQRADLINAGSWYRAVDGLRSIASRTINRGLKWYRNSIGTSILSVKLRWAQSSAKSDTAFAAGPRRKIGAIAVTKTDLSDVYRDYIACLNNKDWPKLGQFVHEEVILNGRRVGLSGYLKMLERAVDEIPALILTFSC